MITLVSFSVSHLLLTPFFIHPLPAITSPVALNPQPQQPSSAPSTLPRVKALPPGAPYSLSCCNFATSHHYPGPLGPPRAPSLFFCGFIHGSLLLVHMLPVLTEQLGYQPESLEPHPHLSVKVWAPQNSPLPDHTERAEDQGGAVMRVMGSLIFPKCVTSRKYK